MTSSTGMSPVEFGNALRESRLAADVSLEAICSRTKIGRRMLELIEAGQFEKLPDRVFVRMFVQQYLDIVGVDRKTWLASFDGAWARYERGSQQYTLAPTTQVQPRRALGPWIIGVLLVALALAVLFVLQRRDGGREQEVELPTATEVATAIAPTPPQPVVVVTSTPLVTITPEVTSDLLFETGEAECWVQVAIAGRPTVSQLMAPHSSWEVTTGEASAEIVVGAAEAVTVTYRGMPVPIVGRPGSVVHLRVPVSDGG